MQTIRVLKKTEPDGSPCLRIPLGRAEAEYDVLVVVHLRKAAAADEGGWPAGYFDLAGSIDDETFLRHPQGALPPPVEFD